MRAFQNMMMDYALTDLGFHGNWFTYERGRTSSNNIRGRLDRGLANDE